MSTVQRQNFFLLLELHPNAPWDQVLFEKTLREKRSTWSRESAGIAKKALIAKQNLALIPLIQQVMTDQDARSKEAAAARKKLASMRQEEYASFEQQLAFLNAREALEQQEVDAFVATFKHLIDEEEILKRLQPEIVASSQSSARATHVLDTSIASNINDRLSFLHMSTLYELLMLPRTTSTRVLFRAAQHLYTRLVLQPPTPEMTAQIELAGLARGIFCSDEMRGRYDATVRRQSLDLLLKQLDESVSRSSNKEVYPGQVTIFLEQARCEGWSGQEALESLKEYARLRKWIMTLPTLSQEQQQVLQPHDHVERVSRTVLTYELKPQTLWNSKRVLRLALDPPGPLPALLIVRKQGGLPLNKTDGYLFHRVEATSTGKREVSTELPAVILPPGTFVKVFLEDDAAYREVIVHHPDARRLRLR